MERFWVLTDLGWLRQPNRYAGETQYRIVPVRSMATKFHGEASAHRGAEAARAQLAFKDYELSRV